MEVKIIGQMDNTVDHTFESANRVYDKNGISPTINTCGGGGLQPKVIDSQIVAMRGRNPDNPSDRTVGSPTEQRLEPNSQGICNTLTSVQKDNLVLEQNPIGSLYYGASESFGCGYMDNCYKTVKAEKDDLGVVESVKIKQATKDGYVECKIGGVADLSFPNSTTRRGRVQDNGDTCPTLMAGEQDICRIETKYRIRKLTPKECWRLMDFTDEDFYKAEEVNSNTQLYKQAGNSICKNVLVAIFGQMLDGKEDVYKEINSTHFSNQQQ